MNLYLENVDRLSLIVIIRFLNRDYRQCLFLDIIFPTMFKKFDEREDVTGTQQLKSSVQKGIRQKLVENYPNLVGYVNEILPKKENFKQVRCRDHVEMIAGADGTVLFVKPRDMPYIPTLRLLHKYPFMLPHQQVCVYYLSLSIIELFYRLTKVQLNTY